MKPNTIRVAMIGFGEVGQRFSRDLLTHDGIEITAFDLLFANPPEKSTLAKTSPETATNLGVIPTGSAADAVSGARYIFSAVTADRAEDVARETAPLLQPGQIFIDVNSASPSTKRRAAKLVVASGAHYLEAAVMAPVLKPGIKVPILAGGPEAAQISEDLNRLGFDLTAVATDYGRASAMKLCRSIMIKGWEALIVDCRAAARHWDVEDQVFSSLSASYPSIDWPTLAEDMGERVATHGIRRAAEMREAADMLADMGLSPELIRAVADAQERGARNKQDRP
jgi:3-hydroxyisobutyrate dehydrogenase-like beta-hydroxyacid dehydrogenase